MDWTESFRKAWVVTGLTVRYLLTTRRAIATGLLALVPVIITLSLAAARVEVLVVLLPPIVVAYGVTEAYGRVTFATDIDVLWGFLATTILGSAAYGALFLFISVLVRRPLAVGLMIGFVWESVVDNIPGDVPKLSVIHYLKTILKDVIVINPLGGYRTDVSAGGAAGILVAVSIALVILAAFVFQQMEFRQKAG